MKDAFQPARILFYVISIVAASLYLYLSYGYRYSTVRLVLIAMAAGYLMRRFEFFRRLRIGLIPWCIAAIVSLLVLTADRLVGGAIFIWKHKHTNLFLGGAPLYEKRFYQGRTIYAFDGGFSDPYIYALRHDRTWFPEQADLPRGHRRDDPLPDTLHWVTYARY